MVTVGIIGITTVSITTPGVIPHGAIMIHGMPVRSVGDLIPGTEAIMVTGIPAIMVMEDITAVGTAIIIMTTGGAEALHITITG